MQAYKHILVGLDLSEDSSLILKKATSMAAQNNAQLSVAHIVEPLNFAYGGDVPLDMTEAQTTIEEQAKIQLKKLLDDHDVEADQAIISVGQTSGELHRLAKETDSDLIIVGCHGRHGLALLFGSTSNGVLHGTECDVLAVRI
jgi:universal stress protein A